MGQKKKIDKLRCMILKCLLEAPKQHSKILQSLSQNMTYGEFQQAFKTLKNDGHIEKEGISGRGRRGVWKITEKGKMLLKALEESET